MILWTIQPIAIWEMIQETGAYRCDPKRSSMPEPVFVEKYDWLIRQMKMRIGPPPEGVVYPVQNLITHCNSAALPASTVRCFLR